MLRYTDYLAEGNYRIDKGGTKTMLNSLMYKLCYYRFGELMLDHSMYTSLFVWRRQRGVSGVCTSMLRVVMGRVQACCDGARTSML